MSLLSPSLRVSLLPPCIQTLVHIRLSSTSTPFPWPPGPSPSPWQIFHLNPGATQEDIKARYYDLVRCYHPDASLARDLPPSVAHARFQAVRSSYEFLSGGGHNRTRLSPLEAEFAARRREHDARVRYRRSHGLPDFHPTDAAEEERNDRILMLVGLGALGLGIAPFFLSLNERRDKRHVGAAASLARARSEARDAEVLRRDGIRARARETAESGELDAAAAAGSEKSRRI